MDHVPTIAPKGTFGRWGVCCLACSSLAGDYVYPCAEKRWLDIPPSLLFERVGDTRNAIAYTDEIRDRGYMAIGLVVRLETGTDHRDVEDRILKAAGWERGHKPADCETIWVGRQLAPTAVDALKYLTQSSEQAS